MARTRQSKVNDIRSSAGKTSVEEPPASEEFISTGSTLLNLALTDKADGGWQLGKMANLIGDSSSGKTFLALTAFAETDADEDKDHYRLMYDDAEHANEFNIPKLFGEHVEERIEPPAEDIEGSETIEAFSDNTMRALEQEVPCVYILDSFDALDAEADQKKSAEQRDARESGKETKGTYGMAKPKQASMILRGITKSLKRSSSVLIIISQTRDNIDPMSFQKKTRSGGKALKFYATYELWTAVAGSITKTVNGKKFPIGVRCRIKVTKNKVTGKVREVEVPIYYDYGIDDIASCIQYLVSEKVWAKAKSGTKITSVGLKIDPCTEAKLIETIEKRGLEKRLRKMVERQWHSVESQLTISRKSKYERKR